jgi:hypothetical protein
LSRDYEYNTSSRERCVNLDIKEYAMTFKEAIRSNGLYLGFVGGDLVSILEVRSVELARSTMVTYVWRDGKPIKDSRHNNLDKTGLDIQYALDEDRLTLSRDGATLTREEYRRRRSSICEHDKEIRRQLKQVCFPSPLQAAEMLRHRRQWP